MINGNLFRDMVISGANNIENQKESINKLNVFPVPDGDTGTNMSLTISAAARDISELEDISVSDVAEKVAFALLRGARGNSGVILSLLFRGISKGLKGKAEADGKDLAAAFESGVKSAYKAVMKPTEGTILTVAREAAEKCTVLSETESDPLVILKEYVKEAEISLDNTPNLLPALKQANVVDAGGKGLLTIVSGMLYTLENGKIIEKSETQQEYDTEVDFSQFDTGEITFSYCTEFIVVKDSEDTKADALRAYLETIGDCVVAVEDEKIIKVHVHTNDPGKAIQKGIEFGYLINMKIDNMKAQQQSNAEKSRQQKDAEPVNDYGFVSVCAGSGLVNIFKDLGVDVVVEGGQTMNPSTEDILQAVRQTPAKTVFVLPNNKNIIMAAEQTKELISNKKVVVLPTKTVPQGISAMLFFNGEADLEENLREMDIAVSGVKTGQITFAARDSVYDDMEIKEGQYLGLLETKVSFVEDDINTAMSKMIEAMMHDGGNIITLYYGSDVNERDAEKMCAAVSDMVGGDVEVTLLPGGQPVYYYIISVE